MKLLQFAAIVGRLKRLPRTGWVDHNVNDPESVAEHSFRVALLAMVLAPQLGIDETKSIKMALIHDLGEAEIGDIVTRVGNKILPNMAEKLEKERKALEHISSLLNTHELVELFDEFEEMKTPEAKLVKQLDRLEMLIQADEYEKEQQVRLDEFFETARQDIFDPELLALLYEVEASRHEK